MSKSEEIKEKWDYPDSDGLDWNDAKDDISILLAEIAELKKDVDYWRRCWENRG